MELLRGIAVSPGIVIGRVLVLGEAEQHVPHRTLDDGEIERYVSAGGWRGKAGGYNLAERLAAGWPIRCEGDPTSVMGLPMARVAPLLRELGCGPKGGGR